MNTLHVGVCRERNVPEPVMKPLTAGAGMNSTSQPIRSRPIRRTIKPQMKATVVAICGPSHSPGWWLLTCLIICETVRDITATGPMETSLDVANNCACRMSGRNPGNYTGGCCTYAVDEDANECRVETIFRWECSNLTEA